MENRLQELTRKIYNEGIEKANQEAASIIESARAEADELLQQSKKEAAEIVKQAQQSTGEMQRNAQSEIRMSSQQAISAIRQQIATLITAKVADEPVKQALADKSFMGSLIMKALENYKNSAALVLPASDEKVLGSYFDSRMNDILKAGVDVSFDENLNGGFKIGPKDKSYFISFTDEDFKGFFRSFMRPRTINLLFGAE